MRNLFGVIRTISPLHCGVGTGMNDIDLPVARNKVSGHPLIPASSLKGVMKDALYGDGKSKDMKALFGSHRPDKKEGLFASAISIGDGTLVALPVRSYSGTFAYLASPYTLEQFRKGLSRVRLAKGCPPVPTHLGMTTDKKTYNVMVAQDSLLRVKLSGGDAGETVLLEELDLAVKQDDADAWAEFLAEYYCNSADEKELFKKRFAIAGDNVLNFFCETSLPVDAHIRINDKTGTVEKQALWYEETVPPEALFFSLIGVDHSLMPENDSKADQLTEILLAAATPELYLQVGGKSTTGKGMISLQLKKEGDDA